MTKKKQIFILVLTVLIFFTTVTVVMLYLRKNIGKIETKENISDLSQLPSWVNVPDSAKNISYCKIFWLYSGYEFDIPEDEFLKWAQKWPIQKITEPETFVSYLRYTLPQPDRNDPNKFQEYESKAYVLIHNGYYFHKESENQNGGGTYVAYDKDKQRAYYSFSFR